MTDSVYVIQSDAGPVKIGVSGDPEYRLRQLIGSQPFAAKIVHCVSEPSLPAYQIEAVAHSLLASFHRRGEWFDVTPEQAAEAIQSAIDLINEGDLTSLEKSSKQSARLQMVISPEEIAHIDNWRRHQTPLPSRSEAIRQLVRLGLSIPARSPSPRKAAADAS